MIDGILSILTGGATGLLGTALSFATTYFQAKQKHAQELELRQLDMETARFEAASAEKTAAIAAEGAENAAAWGALEASYKEASARWSAGDSKWLVFVDVVRGLTRPVLTWASVVLVGVMYFTLGASDTETIDLKPRIIETVLYLDTACVLWWFGARQVSKSAGGAR